MSRVITGVRRAARAADGWSADGVVFTVVADAVGRIQDAGEQLYAAKTLLGKAGPELLAALDGHLQTTVGSMRDLGLVIDEETIAAGVRSAKAASAPADPRPIETLAPSPAPAPVEPTFVDDEGAHDPAKLTGNHKPSMAQDFERG